MSSNRFLNANGVYSTRNYINSNDFASEVDILKIMINRNKDTIATNAESISNIKTDVQTNENSISNHENRINALEQSDVLIKNSVTNINTKAIENTESINNLNSSLNELKLNYQEFKEDTTDDLESHSTRISAATLKANDAYTTATRNTESISTIRTDVTTLQTDVSANKIRSIKNTSEITTLKTNVTTLQTDVASNEHRIENIEIALDSKQESERTLIGYCTNQTRFLTIIEKLYKTTWGNAEELNQDLFNGINDLHNRLKAIEGSQIYLTNFTECPNTERLERFEENIEYFDTNYPYNRWVLAKFVMDERIKILNQRLYADDKNIDLNSCPFEAILAVSESKLNTLESIAFDESACQAFYNGTLNKVVTLEENPLLTNSEQTKNNENAITELQSKAIQAPLGPYNIVDSGEYSFNCNYPGWEYVLTAKTLKDFCDSVSNMTSTFDSLINLLKSRLDYIETQIQELHPEYSPSGL